MRTTIERVVEASHHRSGRAPGFASLRPHKSLASTSTVDAAQAQAGAASNGAAAAGKAASGGNAHQPFGHADLVEQEAARRASAVVRVDAPRLAALSRAGAWIQTVLDPKVRGAADTVGGGGGGAAAAAGQSSARVSVGGDVEMKDAATASDCGHDAPISTGAVAVLANGAGRAGLGGDGGGGAAGAGDGAADAKCILIKDILFILEREVRQCVVYLFGFVVLCALLMYVCLFTHVCVYLFQHMHKCVYTYVYIYTHVYIINIHVHLCTRVHVPKCVYIYV